VNPICAGNRKTRVPHVKKFKVIRSPALSAAENMAFDGELLRRYLGDGVPVFRVYRWKAPSFTYGVSQKPEGELDCGRCAVDGVELSQRMTGGGVLFHHDEITYSFVCGKEDVGEPEGALVSYREICSFLVRFYGALGLRADFALEAPGFDELRAPHELCSASREKYDLVVNGRKIGGNAQKRLRGVIFQHGSVPVSVDWQFVRRYAPSLPLDIAAQVTTLSEELKTVPAKDELEDTLIGAFAEEFDGEPA